MKKVKLFIFVLIALFTLNITVNAKDVSTYATLKACLENDTDATCKLTCSVEPLESDVKTITVTGTKELDLNSNTLTMQNSLFVENGANLTVDGNGTITSSAIDKLVYVKAGGTFSVDNTSITTTKYAGRAVYIKGASNDTLKTKVTIGKNAKLSSNYSLMIAYSDEVTTLANGVTIDVYGTITGLIGNDGWTYGGEAIYVNGSISSETTNPSVINIHEGSKLTGINVPAIYAGGYAVWNIDAATITGGEALSIKAGKFVVNGATLKAVGAYVEPDAVVAKGNSNEPTGASVSITSNSGYDGNIEVTLKDVKVTSENGYAVFEKITLGEETQVKKLSIESGEFEGKEGVIYTGSGFSQFIQKGVFNKEPNIVWVKDAHSIAKIDDKFHVGPERFIEIEPVEGGEVETDLTRTIAGKNVDLTVEPEEGYYVKSVKVVNARNPEEYIEVGTNSYFIMPDYDVLVKVEFVEFINQEGNVIEVEPELEIDTTIESDLKEEITEVIVETSLIDAIDLEKFETPNINLVEVKIVSKLTDIKEEDGKVSLVFDIKPLYSIDGQDMGILPNENLNGEKITIKLPVPARVTDTHAKVTHKSGDEIVSEVELEIQGEGDSRYVVIEPTSFSEFTVDFYTPEVEDDDDNLNNDNKDDEDIKSPQTFDSTTMSILALVSSFIVLTLTVIVFKKRNN